MTRYHAVIEEQITKQLNETAIINHDTGFRQHILQEISCFVKYIPKITKRGQVDKRFTKARSGIDVYHSNNQTHFTETNFLRCFVRFARELCTLCFSKKDDRRNFNLSDRAVRNVDETIDIFLTTLLINDFQEISQHFPYGLCVEDSPMLKQKLKYAIKAALSLAYHEVLRKPDDHSNVRLRWRNKLIIFSALISVVHKQKWLIPGIENFISGRTLTVYGLEPDDWETRTVILLNDVCHDVEKRSRIFIRITECLKKHFPRQNNSTDKMDMRRHRSIGVYLVYANIIKVPGDSTPRKLQSLSPEYSRKLNHQYHTDTAELFKIENRLRNGYGVDEKLMLTKNGSIVLIREYLSYMKMWVKQVIKKLPLSKDEKSEELYPLCNERNEDTDRLILAFRTFVGRCMIEMAKGNDFGKECERRKRKNHIDVLVMFSLLVAVFDELFHVKYGRCGIEIVIDFRLVTRKEQTRTKNRTKMVLIPACLSVLLLGWFILRKCRIFRNFLSFIVHKR